MGKPITLFSLDDFLAWEATRPERHEFHDGEIFAMVGGRRIHNELVGNLYSALRLRLRGSPCKAYVESAKLQIGTSTIVYPDIFVTCDAQDLRTEQLFRSPTLVVEVLSPSTQRYNRGAKFTLYRQIASLREYVLLDPETREVQVYRRNEVGLFTVHDQSGEAIVRLESLGLEVSADEVFDGLDPAVPIEPPPDDG